MKYLTTLEAAHALGVSKQTLLNWLYAGKIPEPPRNPKGYRLWTQARIVLVRQLILDGRLHKRTVVHRESSNHPDVVAALAREVNEFLRDGQIDAATFWRALARLHPGVRLLLQRPGRVLVKEPAEPRSMASPRRRSRA